MNGLLVGIAVYVVLQLGLGLWVARRVHSQDDYLLAGRSLGPVVATMTIFATWFGAETCIGAAGQVFDHGLAGAGAEPFGYAVCLLVMGVGFAASLWRRGFTTVADLVRQRFGVAAERFAVLILVPSSLLWAAAQIRAFAQVLAAAGGVDVNLAIAIAASVVILYTVVGGLLADAITDLVQGLALCVGLVVLLVAVITHIGGIEATWTALHNLGPERLHLRGDVGWLAYAERWAIPIAGSLVAQELVARVLACRSATLARRAAIAGGLLYMLIASVPVLLGLLGPTLAPNLADPEQLLGSLAGQFLGPVAAVVFFGALVSAILSTVDSTLLAAAALTANNVVVPLRPNLGDAARLRLSRGCVLAFGLVAWALASAADRVHSLVEAASAFGSGGLVVVFVFGLHTGIGGPIAALAALSVGLGVWLLGTLWPAAITTPFLSSLLAALVAFLGGAAYEARKNIVTR